MIKFYLTYAASFLMKNKYNLRAANVTVPKNVQLRLANLNVCTLLHDNIKEVIMQSFKLNTSAATQFPISAFRCHMLFYFMHNSYK